MIVKEANNVDYVSQLSPEAKSVISDIRRACEELGSLIKSHPEILNYTDAKLHQIAFNADEDDYRKYFEWFCNDQWEMFSEWLDEHDLTTEGLRYSNSKFYIRSMSDNIVNQILYSWSTDRQSKYEVSVDSAMSTGQDFVYNWYNESYMYSPITLSLIDQLGTDVELNEFIVDIFDLESNDDMTDIEGYISDISDLSFDIENSIIPVIKDIIEGYDFLNELKDNEMNIWNDYVVSEKEQEAEMGIEY